MNKIQTFQAEIQGHESGGAFVAIPFDVEKNYGKKRVKIITTIRETTRERCINRVMQLMKMGKKGR